MLFTHTLSALPNTRLSVSVLCTIYGTILVPVLELQRHFHAGMWIPVWQLEKDKNRKAFEWILTTAAVLII
jgi:hypothetical protein